MYRSTQPAFDDHRHQPTTVFTFCDLPSFVGYGSNNGSVAKLASELLQIFTIAALVRGGLLEKAAFYEYSQKFEEAGKTDSDQ
ncbi:hypothetical protein DFQ30_000371 [Apophysomyces sp. BC1015]|nr:hypothetical protein DFQ30_000371 [Apophysomyces sp. BC1015]